jgi:hypothetical protein
MTKDIFHEKEKGHEAKFKLDQELRFKVRCRRNKLLGLWAAGHLGMRGEQALAYAMSLVRLDLDRPASADVVNTILSDFRRMNLRLAEKDVMAEFTRCQVDGEEQILAEYPMPLDSDHVQIGG